MSGGRIESCFHQKRADPGVCPEKPIDPLVAKAMNTTGSEANRSYYLALILVQPVLSHGTSTSLAGIGQAGPSNA